MSTLIISKRRVDGIMILDLEGSIRLGKDNAYLHNTIRQLVENGECNILLNLGEVAKVDSSGMGELIAAWTTLNRSGGTAKLLNLTKGVEELMTLTKLLTVFETYEDEADAIASFKPKAEPRTGTTWKNANVSFS